MICLNLLRWRREKIYVEKSAKKAFGRSIDVVVPYGNQRLRTLSRSRKTGLDRCQSHVLSGSLAAVGVFAGRDHLCHQYPHFPALVVKALPRLVAGISDGPQPSVIT